MADSAILAPRLLAATRGLALTARCIAAGSVSGLHASRRTGAAREFSQYRAYQPGDEPRHIDWKLFARSDRYFLRESEVDTRVAMTLLLDATESMQHRGGPGETPRKFDLARQFAAALAFLAEAQSDTVSLHAVSSGRATTLVRAGRRQAFQRLVHQLAPLEPAGTWPTESGTLAQTLRRAELSGGSTAGAAQARLTAVFTDGHQHREEIRTALAALRAERHELVFFHFIAPDERDFPYRGAVRFEEWETGRALEADAAVVRAAFLREEQQQHAAWRRAWGPETFDYVPVFTDQPPEQTLRRWLRHRAAG